MPVFFACLLFFGKFSDGNDTSRLKSCYSHVSMQNTHAKTPRKDCGRTVRKQIDKYVFAESVFFPFSDSHVRSFSNLANHLYPPPVEPLLVIPRETAGDIIKISIGIDGISITSVKAAVTGRINSATRTEKLRVPDCSNPRAFATRKITSQRSASRRSVPPRRLPEYDISKFYRDRFKSANTQRAKRRSDGACYRRARARPRTRLRDVSPTCLLHTYTRSERFYF